jgi:hypothetical protein
MLQKVCTFAYFYGDPLANVSRDDNPMERGNGPRSPAEVACYHTVRRLPLFWYRIRRNTRAHGGGNFCTYDRIYAEEKDEWKRIFLMNEGKDKSDG